ncbi:hypothetical protein LJC25_04670 [Bacteroidales bacterium OttesenSCG-928-K03]|nr:hypothetical protein [Odoribacter sp. OttesenSCG-928-L07]MDL2239793.1 hypothetical protein [Bacteroidales bacterium OttesenSCG-928-L14]MDL2240422.1 hypothetical protein [Bacteroidales bacterium OttesenSCG-928-K22]MDL2243003.1 hypothetical protein [Bacteroidales bacterium OttesenSCG-928-K03]
MKKQYFVLCLIAATLLLLTACPVVPPDTEIYSLTGKVQKGPFVKGATITINELNESLNQTGKTFITSTSNNDGSFEIKNMVLESNLVLLTASGYYYNEAMDELSRSQITLQAITNLEEESSVNVNVFTHIIKGRIETLMASGKDFNTALLTAQQEFLRFLGVDESSIENFSDLTIVGNTENDAALLAFSIFVQRYSGHSDIVPQLYAMLTQLLNNLQEDFKDNGEIDNRDLIDELLENISSIYFVNVRTCLERKYAELGFENIIIPNFEKYVNIFKEKYAEVIYEEIIYPEEATPYPEYYEPGDETDNLLYREITEYLGNRTCSFAAIVPFGRTLKIKYTHISGDGKIGFRQNAGWNVKYVDGSTIMTPLKYNEIVTSSADMASPLNSNSASGKFEYFEDDSDTPTYTKIFTWH